MAVLTAEQVVALAAGAGFPDPVTAAAYAGIESGWDPAAVSPTGCVGLWQLCPPPADAADPAANAAHAFQKWQACHGGSFTCDWDPYDGGPQNPQWAKWYQLAQQAALNAPSLMTAPPARSLYGQGVIGQMLTSPWFPGTWEVTQGWGPTSYDGEPEGHGYQHWHAGVDVGLDSGTTLTLPGGISGVARSLDNPDGYGTALVVLVDGGPGILLGHLRQRLVDDGTVLQPGDQLAVTDSTGNSTGPHLHFEVRPQDPKQPLGIARYGGDQDPSSWLLGGAGGDIQLLSATGPTQGLSDAVRAFVTSLVAGGEVLLGGGVLVAGLAVAAYGLRGAEPAALQRDVRARTRALSRPRPRARPRTPGPASPAAESRVRPDMQRRTPEPAPTREQARAKLARGGRLTPAEARALGAVPR